MMGMALQETAVPIVKGSNGVLAMSAAEVKEAQPRPCIRCARCVGVCPLGLMPLDMAAHARAGDLDGAAKVGLADCISCGTCAYVCPAGIPLTQYFNYAKGELAARRAAEAKTEYTRTLVQARGARIEAQERAKKEAAARRKAEREAKKKAEAEAAAAAEETAS